MELHQELADFLRLLGLSVDASKPQEIVGKRRTAFKEEIQHFLLPTNGRAPQRPRRGSILLLPAGAPLPPIEYKEKWFYFEDFLDRIIQADRIAESTSDLSIDTSAREQLEEAFVPQNIQLLGKKSDSNAVSYFFDEWLPVTEGRLLAILAPAGYGKTLLTYRLAQRLASAHISSYKVEKFPRQPLPFVVPFARFRRVIDFQSMILAPLHSLGVTDVTAEAFAYLVTNNRVVLFLDGFDELLEERPAEAQKNLRELIETVQGNGKVVITARSTFFRSSLDVADFLEHSLSPNDVTVVDLLPFDASQRGEVVAKMSPNQTTINNVNRVVESDGVREAMGSPLLLRETVLALRQGDVTFARAPSRAELFLTLEESVYARERRRHAHSFSDRIQREFMRTLAAEMLENNVRGFDWEVLQVAAQLAIPEEVGEAELQKVADHHFLTVDPDSSIARFNHQVFREYFQAIAIVEAIRNSNLGWVTTVLSRRPLPEEVATFVSELAEKDELIELTSSIQGNLRLSEVLLNNLAMIATGSKNADLIQLVIRRAHESTSLSIRIDKVDLTRTNFSNRIFSKLHFSRCNLSGSTFENSLIQDFSLHECDLSQAHFEGTEIQGMSVNYDQRIFGTLKCLQTLCNLGADCGSRLAVEPQPLEDEWEEEVTEVISGRFRRFYIPGHLGVEGSKWDSTIQERNFLGGLDAPTRQLVVSRVVPEMLRLAILTRHRDHGMPVFRLSDAVKDDARQLIENGVRTGLVETLIGRLLS